MCILRAVADVDGFEVATTDSVAERRVVHVRIPRCFDARKAEREDDQVGEANTARCKQYRLSFIGMERIGHFFDGACGKRLPPTSARVIENQ